jgi:hypothetical protein
MESSDDKSRIEKLKGSDNYASWKILMELLLTQKGLESTIAENSRTQEELDARSAKVKLQEAADQKKALAMIGLRVQQDYLGVITDASGSARKAWIEFEKMFQSVTNGQKLLLRQRLATLKMEPGEKAVRYIARAKDLKRDLIQANLDAKEVDLAAACGLSKDYRETGMMLEYQEKPINLDEMLPLLLEHEARIEQDEDGEAEKQNSMAFASKSFKPGFKKNFQKKTSDESRSHQQDNVCYTCGKTGHRSFECEQKPDKDHKCHNCGRKGHIKVNCRGERSDKGTKGGGGYKKTMAFASSQWKDLKECWLLDSGATHHLSGNREFFSEPKEVKNEVPVEGVGADLLKVEGIGKVILLCETEEGVTEIILEDVKYTPGADVNLASLSKFLNKGAVLHGEGKARELQMDGENFLRAENQGDLMVIQTVNRESKAFVAADKGRPEL